MADYKDDIKVGKHSCGFCLTNSHDSCRGTYRNGDLSLIKCPCECAASKPQFCHHCKTTEQDHLGRPWLCDDREACNSRLQQRLEKSDLIQLIRAMKQESREFAATRSAKTSSGRGAAECLCCGDLTKGGRFLPGHDSKWLTQRMSEIRNGSMAEADQVEVVRAVSPALAVKLKNRLEARVG